MASVSTKPTLQEKLRLQERFRSIQSKLDVLETRYQPRALSSKIWPPNAIKDDNQRRKANILYFILMASFICWTVHEVMTRVVSSFKDPVYDSTYERESFKYPVVTICGSEFMQRNHSFTAKDSFGCTFYDHKNPDESVKCSSKVVKDLYWGPDLTDYSPPCVVFNYEAERKTDDKEKVGLDVWAIGKFDKSQADDDLWSALSTYTVLLSEVDLDDSKQKNTPGYFAMNSMTKGFSGYELKKSVNTGSISVYSATLHSQIPGGKTLELLFDPDNAVQYLKKRDPWDNSYLILGSMVGMFGVVGIVYRLFNENVFYAGVPSEDSTSKPDDGADARSDADTRSDANTENLGDNADDIEKS